MNNFLSCDVYHSREEKNMTNKQVFHYHPGIRIDSIPAAGSAGLLFTLATVVSFLAIPEIRVFFVGALVAAIPTTAALYFWHRQTRW